MEFRVRFDSRINKFSQELSLFWKVKLKNIYFWIRVLKFMICLPFWIFYSFLFDTGSKNHGSEWWFDAINFCIPSTLLSYSMFICFHIRKIAHCSLQIILPWWKITFANKSYAIVKTDKLDSSSIIEKLIFQKTALNINTTSTFDTNCSFK